MINQQAEKALTFVYSFVLPPITIENVPFSNLIISLVFSPLILALTQEGKIFNYWAPHIFVARAGPIPVLLILSFPALALIVYATYCRIREKQIEHPLIFTIYSFVVSVSALTIICSTLINFMELVQILTGINSVLVGLTVFAWANTLGGKGLFM